MAPRAPKGAPRGPQEVAQKPQEAPRIPRNGSQETSKRPQDTPQRHSVYSKRPRRECQIIDGTKVLATCWPLGGTLIKMTPRAPGRAHDDLQDGSIYPKMSHHGFL
eukprot:1714059-Pyramimonas_sp.AAC.1